MGSINYFKRGNHALAKGDAESAVSIFKEALTKYQDPFLREQFKNRLELASKKLKKQQNPVESVDVIVPVFNALEDVKKCLDSVIKSASFCPVRIILVNDGSNEETSTFLREFAKKNELVHLIENSINQGYTKAVNTGLRFSNADYSVTLNSDTIVPGPWALRLIECINSNPDIGIVGPLSNAASWQNLPLLLDESGKFAINNLPEDLDLETFQDFIDKYTKKKFIDVPFLNGFCFMIRKKVLDTIGYMDEEAFPIGYGEENDFCLRALKANFKLAIADNAYVYHSKSKSFGHSNKQKLSKQGAATLNAKHGKQFFNQKIDSIRNNKTLHEVRSSLNDDLGNVYEYASNCTSKQQLRIGFLLPVGGGGGGANSVIQEAAEMLKMGFDVHVYVRDSTLDKLMSIYDDVFNIENMLKPYNVKDTEHWSMSSWPERNKNIHFLARDRSILVATMFTTVTLLKKVIKYNKYIMPAYYAQDYEPLFVDPKSDTELYQQAKDSYTLIPGNLIFAKTHWIMDEINKNHGVNVEKVSPSIDETLYCHNERSTSEAFKVLAMIRPVTPRRGAADTMKLLKQLKQIHGSAIDIHIFGCNNNDHGFLSLDRDFEYTNHEILKRSQVAALTRQSNLFIDLSTYQAFGRTGLESMASGCVAILPKLGGADEYIKDGINSFMSDYSDNGKHIIKIVQRLVADKSYFQYIKNNALATASEYSLRRAAMSELAVFTKHLKRHSVKIATMNSTTIYYSHTNLGKPTSSEYVRFMPLLLASDLKADALSFKHISEQSDQHHITDGRVIFQGFYPDLNISKLDQMLSRYRSNRVKVIYDFSNHLCDRKYLEENGFSTADAENVVRQVDLLASSSDLIVAATPHLKRLLSSQYKTPVCIQENMVCDKLWNSSSFGDRLGKRLVKYEATSQSESLSKLIFGYYGTSINQIEIQKFCTLLASSQHMQNWEFQCIGAFQNCKQPNLAFVKRIGLPRNNTYPGFVSWINEVSRDWSLGVIYEEATSFALCQSNVKFLEYAMLGLPIIVSDHPVYNSIARHNENCLVVNNTAEEWINAIVALQNDVSLRASLANQAFNDVCERYLYKEDASAKYYDF